MKHILELYEKEGRDLPWRRTRDPYKILVSEIMLQQTQVDRVIPYYETWIKTFPTKEALAQAEKSEVLALWSGLGFNSRALRLWNIAKELAGKKFPETEDELRTLKGIGPYTARAILAFAFNKEVPVVDTNIRRVFIHELDLDEHISEKELEKIALSHVPKGRSRDWHNALMDYGALKKTARVTGIKPLSKQSTFKGSDREVRGWVLKQLVKEKTLSMHTIKKQFPKKDVGEIIMGMVKEELVKKKGENILI